VLRGLAYSHGGARWAKWHSTHMFIDPVRLTATYRWEGEMLDGRPTPEAEKYGLTDLELRSPPKFSSPVTGEGRVSHVGEGTRLKFMLHRVNNRMLQELRLQFTVRQLRLNEHEEEAQLARAFLSNSKKALGAQASI
jgi:hypothetical protein